MRVAILVFDGLQLLDFAGPAEVLAVLDDRFEVYSVAEGAEPVTATCGTRLLPDHTFASAPAPEVLVVPGGRVKRVLTRPAVTGWIRLAAAQAEVVLSVCTGAFLLARAGLLDGLRVTTYHTEIEALARFAPRARVVAGERFVDHGRVITSAGVAAGIDATLALVARLLGDGEARVAAERLELAAPQPAVAAAMAAGGPGR